MNSEIEMALQAFASYVEWFFIVAVLIMVVVLAIMLCVKGWELYTRIASRQKAQPATRTNFVLSIEN